MGKIITAWIVGLSLPTTAWVMFSHFGLDKEFYALPFVAALIANIGSIAAFISDNWETKK
jgi:hypothetical protein